MNFGQWLELADDQADCRTCHVTGYITTSVFTIGLNGEQE